MAGGRPSKYRADALPEIGRLANEGATDVEMADALGVNVATFHRWKAQHGEFRDTLKVGKDQADARVERSLYARATGFEHDEVDIRVINGEIVQTAIRKVYPPDTTAAIFWLKNRRPVEWRDQTDHKHSGTIGLRAASDYTDDELAATIASASGVGTAVKAKGA